MARPQLVTEEFLRDYVKPVFSALGLRPVIGASAMGDDFYYITEVIDLRLPSHVLASDLRDLIYRALAELVGSRCAEERPGETEILPPVSIATFRDYVIPFFLRLRWQVLYNITENRQVSITGLCTSAGSMCNKAVARELINMSLPELEHAGFVPSETFVAETYEKYLQATQSQSGSVPESTGADFKDANAREGVTEQAQEEEAQEKPAQSPVIDYVAMRKNPTLAKYLDAYGVAEIFIENESIIQKVKPAFADKGWIYSGNHYAKEVNLSVVLNGKDEVVDPLLVIEGLQNLHAKFRAKINEVKDFLGVRVEQGVEIQADMQQGDQKSDTHSETDKQDSD